jgi:hypothetical protein
MVFLGDVFESVLSLVLPFFLLRELFFILAMHNSFLFIKEIREKVYLIEKTLRLSLFPMLIEEK